MALQYLFLDMNAFFASVEQNTCPELRNIPICVAPVMVETTFCISVSYEAKSFGVRTGTRVSDARRMCPGLRVVLARPELYVQIHRQILQAAETVLPIEAVLSIDEMIFRLLQNERAPERAVELGREIKEAIYTRVGPQLHCSVGLAPNRMLAKVAAEMQKPNGLTILPASDLPRRLFPLRLVELPGVGRRMEARLRHYGIYTVRQLAELSVSDLSRIWGSDLVGWAWWHKLRGHDMPEPQAHRGSISHSHVLPPPDRNEVGAKTVMIRLLHRVAARLRHADYWTTRIGLYISHAVIPNWETHVRMPPCQDTQTLIHAILPLWAERPTGPPVKVSVVLGNLIPGRDLSPPLFAGERSRLELAQAMDQINLRYGPKAVYFAGMYEAATGGEHRIAFNHIPDPSIPGA